MKTKKSALIALFLALGILVLVNFVGDSLFFRLDFTEDQRYTLSQATKDILEDLEEPVTVSAYFSEDLKPEIAQGREDFMDLLQEYRSITDGLIDYELINPNEDEELEKKAVQSGVQPVVIQTREKDQNVEQKAYLGAVIKFGEQTEVLPFIAPNGPIEYQLTTAIKKLTSTEKPTIGWVQGHGEANIGAMIEAEQNLSVLYNLEPVDLSQMMEVPTHIITLALVAPKDSLSPLELNVLDRFIGRGGNLMICMDRVQADFQQGMGNALNTGLESWLLNKGIKVHDNFVIDANCGAIGLSQPGSFFPMQISFPYFPTITNFTDHPVSKGLEQVRLNFASQVEFQGDTSQVKFTPLLKTSEKSGTQQAPVFFDVNKRWTDVDFPLQGVTIAGAFEGTFGGQTPAKIIVMTNGSFAVNGQGQQARQQAPDHISLLVNGVDWLSDDTGLIDLRTRGVSSRPIEELEDGTRDLIKYLNFFLPILLAIGYGLVRVQLRKKQRFKLLEQSI